MLKLLKISDIIENKTKFEYLNYITKFGWGFPLLDDKLNGAEFSKFDIILNYPDLWSTFIGPVEIIKGDENDDFDIFVSHVDLENF